MDQQPKIPTLKDAQKPQVKVKGLGAGLTLFDRLKQFKKKDLAFILAGMGTLFMAPLAEHFMMAPENGSADMAPGFRGGAGSGGIFGSGSSPYESGNNSIAQGGAIGGSGDIITPLNVRDPSALVMGPGGTQQPPAGSAAPVTPPAAPASSSPSDYKDALAGAASRAASAAVKKSPLPVPKVALGGSGLRGLGVAGGGSSASGGLGPISSGNQGQAGTGGGGLNLVRPTPGFRSAAGARGPGNPTGLDGTKKAGQNAGDAFSRTGSALSGLNAAAAEQIPTGGGAGFTGNGQGGAGANDKGPGGNGPGGSKSVGESLAFIEAKERMMENLKLEFEKRKLKDPELLLYGIRNDSLKAMASEFTKTVTKHALSFLDPSAGGGDAMLNCGGIKTPKAVADGQMCGEGGKEPQTRCYVKGGDGGYQFRSGPQSVIDCTLTAGSNSAAPSRTENPASTAGGVMAGEPDPAVRDSAASLNQMCNDLKATMSRLNGLSEDKRSVASVAKQITNGELMKAELIKMIKARDALWGTATESKCGDDTFEPIRTENSAREYHGQAIAKLLGEANGVGFAGRLGALISKDEGEIGDEDIKKARELHGKANEILGKAKTEIGKFTSGDAPFDEVTASAFNEGGNAGRITMLARNARTAKEGIRQYPAKEDALLKDLNGLIGGAEGAGSTVATARPEGATGDMQGPGQQKPTVGDVMAANKAYTEALKRAQTLGVTGVGAITETPGAAGAAQVPYDPAGDIRDVKAKITAATGAIGTAGSAAVEGGNAAVEGSGLLKEIELVERKRSAIGEGTTFTIEDADKTKITQAANAAATAMAEMRKKQSDVLLTVDKALNDMKAGTRTGAAAR